ncbi:MAG: DUF3416 domain-containing protein [Alphaproteobacteria bacterium]|nr:DUF3416 domain-containing protein [Alphaproteobacteria bacterium]
MTPESEARLKALAPHRFVITGVTPELDGGRHPIKREVGDEITVSADIVFQGHGQIIASVLYHAEDEGTWHEVPMRFVENDRYSGSFTVERNTRYRYTVEAYFDAFGTLMADTVKKAEAHQNVEVDLIEVRSLVEQALGNARGPDRQTLTKLLEALDEAGTDTVTKMDLLLAKSTVSAMRRCQVRAGQTHYKELEVTVDRIAARFASWYEMFWRSQGTNPMRGATIDECIDRLPYIKDLGFDVVYLVPHHPIGKTNRKGRNNSLRAAPEDPGSPYAIGSEEGGHKAVHPEWGTLEDFRRFVKETEKHGMEVAIDFAIQCSPDHPWVKEHPEWFKWRPDGSIRFAENPPKKYEDIVNVEFYEADGVTPKRDLWIELRDVVQFWIDQGVKIFRVDNPHTKPYPFWEWMIRDIQDRHPDALFLSEAFTRPKLMKGLAKVGFTQSYSYFTWRTGKAEFTEYLQELCQGEAKEYMRANFFVNTPDILPFHLQEGGRPAFLIRSALATTLNSLWGMYNGFELCENAGVPGKEEYINSEKYEYKVWDWDRPGNIRDWIKKLNMIRRNNPALQEYDNLKFYSCGNENILLYGKMTKDKSNFVLVAVNLDPYHPQEGPLELPLWEFNLPDWAPAHMEDLMSGVEFTWTGKNQQIWIDNNLPAFFWRVKPA